MPIVRGIVLSAEMLRFAHINVHPFMPTRRGGARFPCIVKVRYDADGVRYERRKFAGFLAECLHEGDEVTVVYNEKNPAKCKIKPLLLVENKSPDV